MTKFYKTILKVEIISDEHYNIADMTLSDIADHMIHGGFAGDWNVEERQTISHQDCANRLLKMNCDPEFMGIDEDGNEI